ncbi:hypothetical protein [Natronorubrum texcoconense]|uniref:Uncharacterized protein n=1 Tax=Natronorubrum texcoconense TaxID=1095776 RepID=A0A1G9HB67_9EURY|nr:hypothetical protein [Natronorubrum texcoconense]SDL10258.1 hypothetical protein SAMN04515672_0185 [Natronorubrum texcoconense]
MTRKAFNPDVGDRAEFPKLKEQYGEDPARFLQSSKDLAEARIAGIQSRELLEAYRAVAKQILSGGDLDEAMGYIDERERELTGEPITPEPDPTPEPIATDGGTVAEPEPEPEGTTEPSGHRHPDATALEAGQVLVVDVDDTTEFVWPQTPECDAPYILEIHADGEQLDSFTLSKRDLFSRVRHDDPAKQPAEDVAPDAPATAALGGVE